MVVVTKAAATAEMTNEVATKVVKEATNNRATEVAKEATKREATNNMVVASNKDPRVVVVAETNPALSSWAIWVRWTSVASPKCLKALISDLNLCVC